VLGVDVHYQTLPHVLLEASELFSGLVQHRTDWSCTNDTITTMSEHKARSGAKARTLKLHTCSHASRKEGVPVWLSLLGEALLLKTFKISRRTHARMR
jgi:hypothetical protein